MSKCCAFAGEAGGASAKEPETTPRECRAQQPTKQLTETKVTAEARLTYREISNFGSRHAIHVHVHDGRVAHGEVCHDKVFAARHVNHRGPLGRADQAKGTTM